MKGEAPPVFPDSLLGELWTLVRLYRGERVFPKEVTGDAAVVFGAQVLKGGRPSGTLRARALHAARLYRGGAVALVIPTGGVGEHPPSEAEVVAVLLREWGVPRAGILPEREATSTRESARLVAALARREGVGGLVVVTDPLHCVRAVGALRAEGIEASASPVYDSPMWRTREGRNAQLLRELGALMWYRARRRR